MDDRAGQEDADTLSEGEGEDDGEDDEIFDFEMGSDVFEDDENHIDDEDGDEDGPANGASEEIDESEGRGDSSSVDEDSEDEDIAQTEFDKAEAILNNAGEGGLGDLSVIDEEMKPVAELIDRHESLLRGMAFHLHVISNARARREENLLRYDDDWYWAWYMLSLRDAITENVAAYREHRSELMDVRRGIRAWVVEHRIEGLFQQVLEQVNNKGMSLYLAWKFTISFRWFDFDEQMLQALGGRRSLSEQ